MKLTIEVNDSESLDVLRAYAERVSLPLTDAAARLVVTGAKRCEASHRYAASPKGQAKRRNAPSRSRKRNAAKRSRKS